jgi:hypothetical protein
MARYIVAAAAFSDAFTGAGATARLRHGTIATSTANPPSTATPTQRAGTIPLTKAWPLT